LSRLSGQDEVVIGTPVANRHRAEVEPLIGFFVNTQALRIDLSASPSVAQLLAQVRATALAVQDHQDLPFEQVVEALQPQRSLAHSPVFQVMFAWQNAPEGTLQLPGLQLQPVGADASTIKFDLELSLQEAGDCIAGSLGYASGLFDRASVERHIAHWQTLLRALVADEQAIVARLPLLSANERLQLLHGFNDTAAPLPAERCIHELFEDQVARTPKAIALVFEDTEISYAELNAQANPLAHHLIARGVRRGDFVALALPRSADLVIAQLAVLKCGAAYVPLDLEHPAERLRFILDDCRAAAMVCRGESPAGRPDLPCLDLQRLATDGPDCRPARAAHAEDAAYAMYTSGSTGVPKGVVVPHRAVVNFALNRAHARLDPSDRMAFVANPAFDASTFEVWTPLLCGAALVVIDQPTLLQPQALAQRLLASRVTVLHLTAGLLPAYGPALASLLPRLRYLLTGGDRVDAGAVAHLLARCAPQHLLHCYGPTETTTFAVTHEVSALDPRASSLPLGRPIANARIYLLDALGQPVPVGVAGEIHIGGAGIAHGYLNRPELTAERFVPDPFAAKAGARMYRTGDLGRWRIDPHGDGTIEFLGRNDHQVKLRGFRIELGEIEARLREHPDVREAVVLAREDAPGHKRLVAYVVGEPTQPEVLPETLRAHLAAALPEYMVPAAYVGLDALPLTPNGKLDRRALPAPADTAFGQLAYEAPEGELETTLASIWSELLGVQRIGRRDDFFELGGHSLLAVQLASRIRARLGSEVPLADLFAQPTLAGFATRVAAASSSALPAIVPAARQGALPLSFAQQRLWFLAQLDARAAAAYAMPGGVRLRGALDIAALQAALNRIVARHEALRTSFVLGKGEPVQVIAAPEVGLALTQVDLSGHAAPEAELERLAAEEAAAPFDLERGPLIRARLVRLAHDDHVLLVTMHHIVSDGWSMGVLINEFSALYAAFSQGRPDPLPPLDVQYPDYAMWQRRWITGTVLQRQLDFWRAHLEGAPALLELPTDRPRPPVQDYAGASVAFAFDNELSANLKALSQRHGSTLFMTLLASWAALLSRLSEQDEVVIGTPVANRHRAEVEPLIGFFVNTQALRIDLSASPSVGQLLAQVRATALAAQDHQDLPFEQVVEALQPQRSLAHSPVFQVMFSWQNAPEGTLQLPGLQLQPVAADASTIKFDLELSLQEAGNCIAGSLSYASALFDRASVARHIAHWQTLLRALVADDQAIVARLPLLSADERFQLLHGFNNTAAAFPQARCIHQLFEEQAACTPEATALVFEDATLTYRELNAQANRLAHHLIALGVRPDSLVAIALPRGIDMVVALLATLKAGGAYVPLDPAYPAERLGYMLDDCQARWVVTDTAAQTRLSGSPVLSTATVLALDASHQPWNACAGTNPDRAILGLMPSHLAYVIYTSGSTGRPKGAMVEHAGLCNLALARIDGFQVTPSSRVLQFASFSFDACIFEVLMALCSGAALHVPAPGVLAGAALHHVLREGCITHTLLPPTVLAGLPDDSLPQLQTLFTGGEAASHALVQRWATGRRLINAYGPTEATVCATMHVCDTRHPGSPPIGSPIANTRVYILDVHGQPSPVGVAGEIHIAGIQVARGYLRRPDLTAERFVPDPFGEPGSRMYKTGDLGRWQLDGTIEFMGRNDHQVKVRGFRIELGEIEARLLAHPAVREAVVLAREDEPGHTRLVAYVVGQPGQPEVLPEVLRAHVASALPEYMVPAVYVPLDALPLTPNGKLDRLALPAPNELHFLRHQYEAPRMGIEQALAEVWSQVLGVSRIGREDHFFELGGHSLLAVRLLSLSAQRGLHMTLQDVYAYPTLRAQAARLSGTEDSSQPQALAARRDGAATPLFAVPTGTGHTAYAFDLGARLDADVPVYALPWPQTMPASMDALAAYMVSLMRAKQAHGPYRLLGYSSGGLVAYAMAQLLAELDEPVEFVGLLDCRNPEIPSVQETQEERARHLLVGELRERVQQDAYSGQHDLHQAVRLLEEKAPITDWAELVAWAEALPALQSLAQQENTTIAEFAATCLRIAAYEKLWPTYLPRPLPAPLKLHLFYATEEAQLPPPLGWDRLLSSEQVEVVPVGGTHMSMMKPPHLTALGRAISQALSATHRVRTRDTDEF
jgi:amino acid adenylation domain-containing protein